MRKVILSLAITLLLVSAPIIFLIIREIYIGVSVGEEYVINDIYFDGQSFYLEDNGGAGIEKPGGVYINENFPSKHSLELVDISLGKKESYLEYSRTIKYGENIIGLKDSFPGIVKDYTFVEKAKSVVKININNKMYSIDELVELRPSDPGGDRYFSYLNLALIRNKQDSKEYLVIVQRFGEGFNVNENKWRILWLSPNGDIKEETFDNIERQKEAYRTEIINKTYTSPISLGYKSNVLNYYPTFLYPLLYPGFTTIIGLVLLIIGFFIKRVPDKKKIEMNY